MKRVLWINSCMREGSRTEKLSRAFFATRPDRENISIEEVKVKDLDIISFDENMLKQRDEDIKQGNLHKEEYQLAREFAAADEIVISAPYWDASFPSKLKVYIEHICVNSITIAYGEDGHPLKQCKANELTYITSSGGPLSPCPSVKTYMEELAFLFGIDKVKFYGAACLDMFPDQVDEILEKTRLQMISE